MRATTASLLLLSLCLALTDAFVVRVKISRDPTPTGYHVNGAVYSTDGFINCGYNLKDTCVVEVARGSQITLVQQPFALSKIKPTESWTVAASDININDLPNIVLGPSTCSNQAKTCVITVDRDITVTATFIKENDGLNSDLPAVESVNFGEDINPSEGGLIVVRSSDHFLRYSISHSRALKNVTWTCTDGIVRVPQVVPSLLANILTEEIRPTPPLPKFSFCVAKAVWDNSGKGSNPTTITHELPFATRVEGASGEDFEALSESDTSTEGITLFTENLLYWREIPIALAGGETFKRKLLSPDITPHSFPYVADSELTVRAGPGNGTLLINIGYLLASSSTVNLGAGGNKAQIVLYPGDTRTYNIRRVFDVWKGNTAPQVVIIIKNVGVINPLTKKREVGQFTGDGSRSLWIGPLVTNFVESINAPVKVVENKLVHTFDFANAVPVRTA
jgi:hypothetical protein